MFSVTSFYYKWLAKALQELFASSKVIPEPEFQSFDLRSLRMEGPDKYRAKTDAMADRAKGTSSNE
jgi:hypothetical protein